jgi:hypothetical protein
MDRSSLYLMFVAKLLGESVGEEFLDLSGCDVSSLKASVLRKDYDEVTRSLLGKALDEFYKNYGFEARGEPDHLITMLAFMAHAPVFSGRTRGARGPAEPRARRAGAPAGGGGRPPPLRVGGGVWAGLSGPVPGGGQLSRPCPPGRRRRVSLGENAPPCITNCFRWFGRFQIRFHLPPSPAFRFQIRARSRGGGSFCGHPQPATPRFAS